MKLVDLRGERVLLIVPGTPNAGTRKVLVAALEKHGGCIVHAYFTANEAWAVLAEDLVSFAAIFACYDTLFDGTPPLIERIRTHSSLTIMPVIAITGGRSQEEQNDLKRWRNSAFLSPGFDAVALARALENINQEG